MHHWLLEQRRRAALAEKDLYEDDAEVTSMLNEAIEGTTREERLAQIEGESWNDFMKVMGG